jgi:hypothetical protein
MVVATQKPTQGFRIPIRTGRLVFHGDWEGAEVVVRISVPVQIFIDIQDLITDQQQLQVFDIFGEKIIESWNIQDDNGLPIEATGRGMCEIPIQLANLIVEQWVEVATQPSLPLDEN